ncbi:RNaseH domain-containing protein [Amycolatopsis mediterranei]|uniref:RNaseH domain-containing protein n=1 Tax=Amycolatopsis mediterranei TaxID=33910 RepID=UPI003436D997
MALNTRRRLDVLAYRGTPELLGDAAVYIREFDRGVTSLWRMFDRDYRDYVKAEEAQAPHSVVVNALRCLTGGYAAFDPVEGFLVTREEIDDDTLLAAFTLMHGRVLGTPIDEIDLTAPPRLAERIAESKQEQRLLADYLHTTETGQPDAPTWVYNTVAWDLSRRIAERPWRVNGREIALRVDSRGGLIAWQDPWTNKSGTAEALSRAAIVMKTLPNIADPILLVSPTVTRIQSRMAWARTVLVEQDDLARPIVEVAMAGRSSVRRVSAMALDVLARLGVQQSILRHVQDRVVRETQAQEERDKSPGQDTVWAPESAPAPVIRPIQSKNFRFPIGRGVGMHHLRELRRHIDEALGDALVTTTRVPVYFEGRNFKQLDLDDLLPDPNDIARSLDTMGYRQLRIVCLWNTDEVRRRMLDGLRHAYSANDCPGDGQPLDPADGVPLALDGDVISAVFHRVPGFLDHGPNAGSAEAIAHVQLDCGPDTLVGVWAETEFTRRGDEEDFEDDGDEIEDDATEQATSVKEDEDAKFRARRTLACAGINSQFIIHRTPRKPRKGRKVRDYPVIHSLLDLHRSLGIIDYRITDVMVDQLGPHAPDAVAHCAVHVRRQSKRGKDRTAKICITATVLKPPAHDGQAWTLHGWSYTDPTWRPYHQAQAAFHAKDYPTGKMTELQDDNAGYKKVAGRVDGALADLARYLGGTPYTVTVDAFGSRRLWSGLHNNKQGEAERSGTWLPGSTIQPSDRPRATVRVNKNADEMFRALGITLLDENGEKVGDGDKTTNSLFRVKSDFGDDSFALITVPNQYDGQGAGRLGSNKTRWTADHGSDVEGELRRNEMKDNWYAMTTLGIFPVAVKDGINSHKLAVMTARLCHQALAWAERTTYPAHLHAAAKMDLDHPQYRRTAAPSDSAPSDVPNDGPTGDDELQ